jgi:hypothetical protein
VNLRAGGRFLALAGRRGGTPVCRSRPLEAARGGRRLSRNCRAPRGTRAGDVVTADDGLPYLSEVIGQDGGRVQVAPITGPKGVRTVTSREVVEHWRKARARQPGGG